MIHTHEMPQYLLYQVQKVLFTKRKWKVIPGNKAPALLERHVLLEYIYTPRFGHMLLPG